MAFVEWWGEVRVAWVDCEGHLEIHDYSHNTVVIDCYLFMFGSAAQC